MSYTETRSREEHLQWCKDRALEYLPADPSQAFASFISDVGKHGETAHIASNPLNAMALMSANNPEEMRKFIVGWN